MAAAAEEAAAKNEESIERHIVETHSSPEIVGRMATEAGVKTVVLNHLVGIPSGNDQEKAESELTTAVQKFFSGKVIVGRDQLRI